MKKEEKKKKTYARKRSPDIRIYIYTFRYIHIKGNDL